MLWFLVGNQLLILLISFAKNAVSGLLCWESVTNPLDKLCFRDD